jgi:hypothetical protein
MTKYEEKIHYAWVKWRGMKIIKKFTKVWEQVHVDAWTINSVLFFC